MRPSNTDGQRKRKGKHRPNNSISKHAIGPSCTGDTSEVSENKKSRKRPRTTTVTRPKPSKAVLELSARLKELSTQKRYQECLDLYFATENDHIRDEHHACIVIDCMARCGRIQDGEVIVKKLREASAIHSINVETNTALLKGYVHCGRMMQATQLFHSMCDKGKRRTERANTRTLNTFLRGCLWTATNMSGYNNKGQAIIVGGVKGAIEAWQLFSHLDSKESKPDCTSYEYFIAHLSYALRVDEALRTIEQLKETHGVVMKQGKATCDDSSVLETLAMSLVSISRAFALLGRNDEAKASSMKALSVITGLEKNGLSSSGGQSKRAFKQQDRGSRRDESNALFRSHRLSEARNEANFLQQRTTEKDPVTVGRLMASRLFYFSGGGSSRLSQSEKDNDITLTKHQLQSSIWTSIWYSFGLNAFCSLDVTDGPLTRSNCKRIRQELSVNNGSAFGADGTLSFTQFLGGERLIHLELGSGHGDWVVQQAKQTPEDIYVAVELRADRVAQMFAKATLMEPSLNNLFCVGADCKGFLQDRIQRQSLSTIFVNHPEPPTQTFGADSDLLAKVKTEEEPCHMLDSETIQLCLERLKPSGRLVIVTDNRWYSKLVSATILKVLESNSLLKRYRSVDLSTIKSYERSEVVEESALDQGEVVRVFINEGNPNESIGHRLRGENPCGGVSYFDRLWRSGAGTHADTKKRYIIVIQSDMDESQSVETGKKKRKKKLGRRERERMKKSVKAPGKDNYY